MAARVILLASVTLLAWTYLVYPAGVIITARLLRKRAAPADLQPEEMSETHPGESPGKRTAPADLQPEEVSETYPGESAEKRASALPLPEVTVLMAVHNEEKVIAEKLESMLASDYPPRLLRFMIGSDCSTDGTDAIIAAAAAADNRIILVRESERRGKAAMLNRLAAAATGEVMVITDANVIFTPATIRELAEPFADAATGLCDATVRPRSAGNIGVSSPENLYSRLETRLKRAEGELWGAMPGPYGGCYAIRRELFPVLPGNILVDDLYAGLAVLREGYRAFNRPGAVVFEDIQPDMMRQYRRRVRIATGSYQNLFMYGFCPARGREARLAFFSHKILRWLSPLLLLLFLMTTIILSFDSKFYLCLLALLLILTILSALDLLLNRQGKKINYQRYITQFLLMNIALAAGFVKAAGGVKSGIWEPTKRE